MNKQCGQCAFRDAQTGICPIFKQYVDNNCSCPHFTNTIYNCNVCNTDTLQIITYIINDDSQVCFICPDCYSRLGTCQMCKNKKCNFEDDPSPLPKTIQKQMRQGNMITTFQVMNPARMDITCKQGCPCYDEENNACFRQNGTCGNYEMNYIPNSNI